MCDVSLLACQPLQVRLEVESDDSVSTRKRFLEKSYVTNPRDSHWQGRSVDLAPFQMNLHLLHP
jgi:hypothetical protein